MKRKCAEWTSSSLSRLTSKQEQHGRIFLSMHQTKKERRVNRPNLKRKCNGLTVVPSLHLWPLQHVTLSNGLEWSAWGTVHWILVREQPRRTSRVVLSIRSWTFFKERERRRFANSKMNEGDACTHKTHLYSFATGLWNEISFGSAIYALITWEWFRCLSD